MSVQIILAFVILALAILVPIFAMFYFYFKYKILTLSIDALQRETLSADSRRWTISDGGVQFSNIGPSGNKE